MNVFNLRDQLINDYSSYIESFIALGDEQIAQLVREELDTGLLWPEPLIQLNPAFEFAESVQELSASGVINEDCGHIFRIRSADEQQGRELRLYQHQAEAIKTASRGHNYVLTTGTGSGKSLAYIIPIVNHILQNGSGRGIQAIVVYPMNALVNSQYGELGKFLKDPFSGDTPPITFERYTGQEGDEIRDEIKNNPPDILLTNYVMLELILTRVFDRRVVEAAQGLKFLVLDELHTYRGRQGSDVAMLVRRVRDRLNATELQCVGTSATLAVGGSFNEQQRNVAEVATTFFGSDVAPDNVIGETLQRRTPELDENDASFLDSLRDRVGAWASGQDSSLDEFIVDPLSTWIESTFGITRSAEDNRLVRATPRSLSGEHGAAENLSNLTSVEQESCEKAIQNALLTGNNLRDPLTNDPIFAFRLHQFISRGDTVYASLEPEANRHVTLYGQQFVPGDRSRVLLPLVFCRECGQEYYCVYSSTDESGKLVFTPRDMRDRSEQDGNKPGFLYINTDDPWPVDEEDFVQRLPDDWLEERPTGMTVRDTRRKYLPQNVRIDGMGCESGDGVEFHFLPAPFRFCLKCGIGWGLRLRSDYTKLTSLSEGGRSTATTISSLSVVTGLRESPDLPEKLLSFTDNRQDASLQAGHLNDFVEIGLLRWALYQGVRQAGSDGLTSEELPLKVFDALSLPFEAFAQDPEVQYLAKTETERALREMLGYRLYRDLRRGWRVTMPNLEQCGLLEIHYLALEDLCNNDEVWKDCDGALSTAAPEDRITIAKVLLDYMRRELAIKVNYLDDRYQEAIKQLSDQRLSPPWAIDENERMEHAAVLFPRSRRPRDYRGHLLLSPRGGFGQFLRRPSTFPQIRESQDLERTAKIIRELLAGLRLGGLVQEVVSARDEEDIPGYQIPAAALLWVVGAGTKAFHDPIRVPRESSEGSRVNPFFIDLYSERAETLAGFEAREHTAQVQYEQRQQREQRFRDGDLPILYCSPTMELGVDISDLNAVNMRNVPPTPANYAQRSGRAGRSGQPALAFTYCTNGSPHDQYFFKRPELMVSGAVSPPRLELANEDLLRAHVQAIWLEESSINLGSSLKEILDLEGDDPSLEILESIQAGIDDEASKNRALQRAEHVLETLKDELKSAPWYSARWLDDIITRLPQSFNQACDRWRGLYSAALTQARNQDKVIRDPTRSARDKNEAERLRREAESQLKLLTETADLARSDFYSYRYFASEGFLPGYNFPRLPLSAYVPARRAKQRDEYLQRPRFLAISEFGPRSFIYHEGSRYTINKVILPVGDEDIATTRMKQCGICGYMHIITDGDGVDLCERCGKPLGAPLTSLFQLQNVATKRRDKITSDEEERLRIGYEIITGIRFSEHGGEQTYQTATVLHDGEPLVRMNYGQAARLFRINMGWIRRENRNQLGFVLDLERGYWESNKALEDLDEEDPMSARLMRVIPFVEDRRNALLFEPASNLTQQEMASLQSALKNAIQFEFNLEDNELATDPLPTRDDRQLILIYESAEGGAGVLRQLIEDPKALPRVARTALSICHFDPDTGDDLRRAPRAKEDCEAACYDCLLSYSNQSDHALLDRKVLLEWLRKLAESNVETAPGELPRRAHFDQLLALADSSLEERWLKFIYDNDLHLPSRAQVLIKRCSSKPDFLYDSYQTAIYVDGPPHDFPDRQRRDERITEAMLDLGYTVIRFSHYDDWDDIIRGYPDIFGKLP